MLIPTLYEAVQIIAQNQEGSRFVYDPKDLLDLRTVTQSFLKGAGDKPKYLVNQTEKVAPRPNDLTVKVSYGLGDTSFSIVGQGCKEENYPESLKEFSDPNSVVHYFGERCGKNITISNQHQKGDNILGSWHRITPTKIKSPITQF